MFECLMEKGFDIASMSHAGAILRHDFPDVLVEIEEALKDFKIGSDELIAGGGGEGPMTQRLRRHLNELGWPKKEFNIQTEVNQIPFISTTHEVDHVKTFQSGTVALDQGRRQPMGDGTRCGAR